MPQTTTQFAVIDGNGAARIFQAEQDISSGSLTPHHVVETLDQPVGPANPFPIRNWDGVVITQTVVSCPAVVDTQLVGANPNRRSLLLMNIDLNPATLAFGGTASIGAGLPLDPAAISGGSGGSMTWHNVPPVNSVHAISQAGTRIVVLEGV